MSIAALNIDWNSCSLKQWGIVHITSASENPGKFTVPLTSDKTHKETVVLIIFCRIENTCLRNVFEKE